MINILAVLNYIVVLIYGVILALSFVEATKTKRDKQIMLILIAVLLIIQLFVFLAFGDALLFKAYPFVIHIPLLLFLIFGLKKSPSMSLVVVLSAYLLCTPRKWIGTFVAAFFNNSQMVSYTTQILVTVPILFLICKHFSPYVVTIKNESKKTIMLFAIVPLLYYIMEYSLTVYSNLLYSGGVVVVEFVDCTITVSYFFFSILYISEINRRREAEMDRKINILKSEQAENEIGQLRKSQEQSKIYRHDLKHHLAFIRECIENSQIEESISYINEICTNIENHKVDTYCENMTVNLILSAYIAKAKEYDITVNTDMKIAAETNIPAADLCIILANAMDNAIHACENIENVDNRFISIAARQQKDKLFLKIENPFSGTVEFKDDLPKTDVEGHGIGVKSISIIVKKHDGLFSFIAKDGIFTMMVSM